MNKNKIICIILLLTISKIANSINTIDSLKLILKKQKNDTVKCNLLYKLIELEPNYKLCDEYNKEIIKIADKQLLVKEINNNEKKFYLKIKARALNNLAVSLSRTFQDPNKMYNILRTALKIQEDINDLDGLRQSLRTLAYCYGERGENILEEYYIKKAYQIALKSGNDLNIFSSLCDIGNLQFKKGNYKNALSFYSSAKNFIDKCDNPYIVSGWHSVMAMVYDKLQKTDSALYYFYKTLKYAESVSDTSNMVSILNELANLHLRKNQFIIAESLGRRSFELIARYNQPKLAFKAADILRKIFKKKGDCKNEIKFIERCITLKNQINNIENEKAVIKNKMQMEYEKKNLSDSLRSNEEKNKIVFENKIELNRQQNQKIFLYFILITIITFSIILFNRFKTTKHQKLIIENKEKETLIQKQIIEEKQKEILDSINYAKRIQYTLLAHEAFLKENLREHFTFFNPKDIVSGDFYWATKQNDKFYLAVCDSTGHGVPGAFMSLLNIGFLAEAINEKGIEKPNEVFDYVREKLTETISKQGQRDGFDGILVCFEKKNKTITYAAANNSPLLIQNNQLIELPSDRMPVGIGERKEKFKLFSIDAKPNDIFYLYTDGYADQFGGPKGKKFKYKQLNELLLSLHAQPLSKQQTELKKTFEEWKGNLEQIDDVCAIGIRV